MTEPTRKVVLRFVTFLAVAAFILAVYWIIVLISQTSIAEKERTPPLAYSQKIAFGLKNLAAVGLLELNPDIEHAIDVLEREKNFSPLLNHALETEVPRERGLCYAVLAAFNRSEVTTALLERLEVGRHTVFIIPGLIFNDDPRVYKALATAADSDTPRIALLARAALAAISGDEEPADPEEFKAWYRWHKGQVKAGAVAEPERYIAILARAARLHEEGPIDVADLNLDLLPLVGEFVRASTHSEYDSLIASGLRRMYNREFEEAGTDFRAAEAIVLEDDAKSADAAFAVFMSAISSVERGDRARASEDIDRILQGLPNSVIAAKIREYIQPDESLSGRADAYDLFFTGLNRRDALVFRAEILPIPSNYRLDELAKRRIALCREDILLSVARGRRPVENSLYYAALPSVEAMEKAGMAFDECGGFERLLFIIRTVNAPGPGSRSSAAELLDSLCADRPPGFCLFLRAALRNDLARESRFRSKNEVESYIARPRRTGNKPLLGPSEEEWRDITAATVLPFGKIYTPPPSETKPYVHANELLLDSARRTDSEVFLLLATEARRIRELMLSDFRRGAPTDLSDAEGAFVAGLALLRGIGEGSSFIDTRLTAVAFARLLIEDYADHTQSGESGPENTYLPAVDAELAAYSSALEAVAALREKDLRLYVPLGNIAEEHSRTLLEFGEYEYYKRVFDETRAEPGDTDEY